MVADAQQQQQNRCVLECHLRLVISIPAGLPEESKFAVYKVILTEEDRKVFSGIAPPYVVGPPGMTDHLCSVKVRAKIRTSQIAEAIACKDKYVICRGMTDLVVMGLGLDMRLAPTKTRTGTKLSAHLSSWLSSGAVEAVASQQKAVAADNMAPEAEDETDARYAALAFAVLEAAGVKPGTTRNSESRYRSLFEAIVRHGVPTPTSTQHAAISTANSPAWKIVALGEATPLDGSVFGRTVDVTAIAAAFSGRGSLKAPPAIVTYVKELAVESLLEEHKEDEDMGDDLLLSPVYDDDDDDDESYLEPPTPQETTFFQVASIYDEPTATGRRTSERSDSADDDIFLGSEDSSRSSSSSSSSSLGSNPSTWGSIPSDVPKTGRQAEAPELLLAPSIVSRALSCSAKMGLSSTSVVPFLWLVDHENQARDFSPALLALLRAYGWAAISSVNLMVAELFAQMAALAPEAALAPRLLVACSRLAVYTPRLVESRFACTAVAAASPYERAVALVDSGRAELAMDAVRAAGLRDSLEPPATDAARLIHEGLAADPTRVASARIAARDLLRDGWVTPSGGGAFSLNTESLARLLYAEDLVAYALGAQRQGTSFGFREFVSVVSLYDTAAAAVLGTKVAAVITATVSARDAIRKLVTDGLRRYRDDEDTFISRIVAVEEAASFLVNPSRKTRFAAAQQLFGQSRWCLKTRTGSPSVAIIGAKHMDYAQLAAAVYCAHVVAEVAAAFTSEEKIATSEDVFVFPQIIAETEFWEDTREDFSNPFASGDESGREAAFFELRAAGWITELPPVRNLGTPRAGASAFENTGGILPENDGSRLPYDDAALWAVAATLPGGAEAGWLSLPRLDVDGRRPASALKGALGAVTPQLSSIEELSRMLAARAAGRDIEAEAAARNAYSGDWPDAVFYGGTPPGHFRSEPEAAEAFLHCFGIMPDPEVQAAPGARALCRPGERVYVEDTGELGTVRRVWAPFSAEDGAPTPTWPTLRADGSPTEYVRHVEERTVVLIERARCLGRGYGVCGRAVGDLTSEAAKAADAPKNWARAKASKGESDYEEEEEEEEEEVVDHKATFEYFEEGREVSVAETAHGLASSCCRSGAFCGVLDDVSNRVDAATGCRLNEDLEPGNTLLRVGGHRLVGAQALRATAYRGAPVPRAVLVLFADFTAADIVAAASSCGRLAVIMVSEPRPGLPAVGTPEAAAAVTENNAIALAAAAFRLARAGPLRPTEGAVACAIATPEGRARVAYRATLVSGCDKPRVRRP